MQVNGAFVTASVSATHQLWNFVVCTFTQKYLPLVHDKLRPALLLIFLDFVHATQVREPVIAISSLREASSWFWWFIYEVNCPTGLSMGPIIERATQLGINAID